MLPSTGLTADRKSNTREERIKYLIVTEGMVSESNYFRMVSENVPDTVKGPMVDVVVLSRYGLQGGYSDPCRLFRLTRDYLRMLETGEYTVDLLVGRVLESFYRVRSPKKHDINELETELERALSESGHTGWNGIADASAAFDVCLRYLDEKYGVKNLKLVEDKIEFHRNTDKVCIVIDRDKSDSRDTNRYCRFLDACAEEGYLAYVSNPRFELWSVMHFDISGDVEKLRDPIMCEPALVRLCGQHQIGKKTNYSKYASRIGLAIENSERFENDPKRLESIPGTNLGKLMKMLGFRKKSE